MPPRVTVPEVKWNKHRECWQLRFSHNGVRFSRTFGKKQAAAQKEAAIWFADVISGRQKIESADFSALPFREAYVEFLTETANEIGGDTLKTYTTYGKHFARFFDTLGDITESNIGSYQRARLGEVKRATLRKESAKLGQFIRWLVEEKHYLETPPGKPRISPKATGTSYKKRRRGKATPVTVEQIEAIIALLPEWSRSRDGQPPFPVRDRFIILWETGLRPDSTIGKVEAHKHYRKGTPQLVITADIDKNRWARTIPVSERAAEAFDRCWPTSGKGLMFGQHDFRHHVKGAAAKVLPPDLAERFTDYDLRHARITLWCFTQAHNLGGIAFLIGDDINTLRHYCHPDEAQAMSVLGYSAGYAGTIEEEGEDS